MAYHILRETVGVLGDKPCIVATLDEPDDVDTLAASGDYKSGSIAVVADNSGVSFIVNPSGEWVQFSGEEVTSA